MQKCRVITPLASALPWQGPAHRGHSYRSRGWHSGSKAPNTARRLAKQKPPNQQDRGACARPNPASLEGPRTLVDCVLTCRLRWRSRCCCRLLSSRWCSSSRRRLSSCKPAARSNSMKAQQPCHRRRNAPPKLVTRACRERMSKRAASRAAVSASRTRVLI